MSANHRSLRPHTTRWPSANDERFLCARRYRLAAIIELPTHGTLDIHSSEYVHLALPERLDATAIRLFSVGAYLIWIKVGDWSRSLSLRCAAC